MKCEFLNCIKKAENLIAIRDSGIISLCPKHLKKIVKKLDSEETAYAVTTTGEIDKIQGAVSGHNGIDI